MEADEDGGDGEGGRVGEHGGGYREEGKGLGEDDGWESHVRERDEVVEIVSSNSSRKTCWGYIMRGDRRDNRGLF